METFLNLENLDEAKNLLEFIKSIPIESKLCLYTLELEKKLLLEKNKIIEKGPMTL